jgi:hypothetical protein
MIFFDIDPNKFYVCMLQRMQFYADTSDENSSKESLDLCNVYPCLLSQGINSNLKLTGKVLFYRPAKILNNLWRIPWDP